MHCIAQRGYFMQIKNISNRKNETKDAMRLVRTVFMRFEAPDYSDEGIRTFLDFIDSEANTNLLALYAAYDGDELRGVIAIRNGGNHISLFFVDEHYQGQGIGRQLFETAWMHCSHSDMTVNASPFAVKIYERLGFRATDDEQTVNGIRFTPMRRCGAS